MTEQEPERDMALSDAQSEHLVKILQRAVGEVLDERQPTWEGTKAAAAAEPQQSQRPTPPVAPAPVIRARVLSPGKESSEFRAHNQAAIAVALLVILAALLDTWSRTYGGPGISDRIMTLVETAVAVLVGGGAVFGGWRTWLKIGVARAEAGAQEGPKP